MATKWTSPVWRMPENSNQSKLDNYSLDFNNAITNKIVCGDAVAYSAFTLSAWANPSSPASYAAIFGSRNGAGDFAYLLSTDNTNKFRFTIDDGSSKSIYSDSTFSNDTWYHIACVADGTNIKMYINGTLQADTDTYGTLVTPSDKLMIGAQFEADTQYEWSGKISQTALFDYALSETQVKYLFNNNAGGSTPNPQNPMAITGPTPVAYYPLGGSSTGSSSTLTIPNESGSGDTVFDFDGTNPDNISFGTGIGDVIGDNYTGGMSISLWFKADVTGGQEKGLFVFSTGNNNFGEITAYFQSNSLRLLVKNNTVLNHPFTDTTSWHNLFINFIGPSGDNQVYLDGAPIGSTFTYTDLDLNGKNLTIGYTYSTTYDYQGKMSNFQIWNTSLSGAEITTLYNGGRPYTGTQPKAANLKGWWKMNVDTSNWDGSGWTISDISGDFKNSLGFDGAGIINISGTSSPYTPTFGYQKNVSFSFWARTTETFSSLYQVRYPIKFVGIYGNDDMFKFKNSSTSKNCINTFNNKYGSTKINDGNWHNIVMTYNYSTGTAKYYVDGSIETNAFGGENMEYTLSPNAGRYFRLSIGNNLYNGQISNLTIFDDTELTSTQVNTLYNSGLPETNPSSSPTSWWKLDNTTTGIQDSIGSNNGTNDGAVESGISVSKVNGTSSGMTTANLVTSDLNRSLLYSSYSMVFDGASEDIRCGNSLGSSLAQAEYVTVSCWVYFNNITEEQGLWNFRSGDNTNDIGTSLSLYSSGTVLRFAYYEGGNNGYVSISNPGFSNENWYNIICVYDKGAAGKIYINGQAQTVVDSGVYSTVDFSSDNFYIGSYYSSTYSTNGNLSNIAVWNSELTSDQVLTVYNGGAPNDISSLSPIRWWSLSGDSYFDGSDFICPNLTSSSNDGTSYNLTSTDLVGNAPGSTSNGTGTSMNIPGNLEGNAPNSDKNAYSVNMIATNRGTSVPDISS